jgi:hypothetical protein
MRVALGRRPFLATVTCWRTRSSPALTLHTVGCLFRQQTASRAVSVVVPGDDGQLRRPSDVQRLDVGGVDVRIAVEEPDRVLTSVACEVAVGVRATIVALHASRQSAVALFGSAALTAHAAAFARRALDELPRVQLRRLTRAPEVFYRRRTVFDYVEWCSQTMTSRESRGTARGFSALGREEV